MNTTLRSTEQPEVLLIDEVAEILRLSVWQIRNLERLRVFPIPRLPALDRKPRYSAAAVRRFATGQVRIDKLHKRKGQR
jgi:hypothetical protein